MPSRTVARTISLFAAIVVAAIATSAVPAVLPTPQGEQGAASSARGNGEPVRYDRDVRPILAERCFTCHGRDASKRKADLRLDDRTSATADHDGVRAIVPGDLGNSELWRRITATDHDERMPPLQSGKRALTAAEQDIIRRWLEGGAVYEPHWSFTAPVRPELPAVKDANWSRNAIDRFVLAKLESHDAVPSPLADAATLARRIYLTVTGLPPTPEESDAFAADQAPGAAERLCDQLLGEEPWRSRHAEHFATQWLDAARYADTIGIHTDNGRQLWPWRDWVLHAFRDGMRYDQFVTDQLAGDLLPDATLQQKVATGFLRAHVISDEGGAIAEECLVEYAVDRASTTGSVFLGLTMGCARCHEHKYDPISHEDFYRFYAFFNSVQEPGLYTQQTDPERAHEPFLVVPSREQEAELANRKGLLATARKELEQPVPGEAGQRAEFVAKTMADCGVSWPASELVTAVSAGGATMTAQPDGSVLWSGKNPARDDHSYTVRTNGAGLRLLLVEALPDPSLGEKRIGRFTNGNAVLTAVDVEATSVGDPQQKQKVPLVWAFADHEQQNGDYAATNVLSPGGEGWAVDAHRKEGGRVLLLLAEKPFGFAGGTDVTVRLRYQSGYDQHVLGRVRLSLGTLAEAALDLLPEAQSFWSVTGPFPVASGQEAWEHSFGPEQQQQLDRKQNFGAGNQTWRVDPALKDGRLNTLADGVNVSYAGKRVFAPKARKVTVALGSDDGFRLFVRGSEVAGRQVDRSLAADQDRAEIELPQGESLLCFKVVNTGGNAGFYLRREERPGELAADLVLALLPEQARTEALQQRLDRAWRTRFLPGYRERSAKVTELEQALALLEKQLPRTIVMQERPEPRPTFVLQRGAYDKPDKERRVQRGVPVALGTLPEGAPADRRGLAQWLCSPENPLVARVAVNRLWELCFGTGIVPTSEDFGMQGSWPSHPELLDWLAVELRESGWDLRHVLRLVVTSATFQQSSRARTDLCQRDPDNRWLACYPRRRLSAEQIRDQALHVSGLLAEQFGGPGVKPVQPEGLWQEVAMPASNTRIYVPGKGRDLHRRSLYTYWKRACPPPNLMAFDAPTREFCTVRRIATNTPLQALVIWNDPQFVEAAAALAARTLAEPGSDAERLGRMLRRCTGRAPGAAELESCARALERFRARYQAAPADAAAVVKSLPMGDAATAAELAAWTLLANACLSLDASLCTD